LSDPTIRQLAEKRVQRGVSVYFSLNSLRATFISFDLKYSAKKEGAGVNFLS